MSHVGNEDTYRLDKWLWAARFFKTRSLATAAINGGKIQVNGNRAKPARAVQMGDEVRVTKDGYEYLIRVRGLSNRRGPATEAAQLYEETTESVLARAQRAAEQRLHTLAGTYPSRRPTKRERRHIIRFKDNLK